MKRDFPLCCRKPQGDRAGPGPGDHAAEEGGGSDLDIVSSGPALDPTAILSDVDSRRESRGHWEEASERGVITPVLPTVKSLRLREVKARVGGLPALS